jgi:hypothetical protein
MSEKLYLTKSPNKHTYTPRWDDKSAEHKPYNQSHKYNQCQKNNYDNTYTSKCNDNLYTTQHKEPPNNTYTFSKQKGKLTEYKSNYTYPQQKINDNTIKQVQPRNIYKYKIERDKSGNCSYVLEEPLHNPIKLINNYEIKCVYPINMNNYYKNVNIYNYKKKIII